MDVVEHPANKSSNKAVHALVRKIFTDPAGSIISSYDDPPANVFCVYASTFFSDVFS